MRDPESQVSLLTELVNSIGKGLAKTANRALNDEEFDALQTRLNAIRIELKELLEAVEADCRRPERIHRLRPSRRTLSMSRGRLWRELWRSPERVILESGPDFVVVPSEEGKPQFWFRSFEEAYLQLAGAPWHAEGGQP
jgi:hypothetical protein